jgi:hypothetical protein
MDQPDPEDGDRLMRLDRRLYWYFAMAFAAPLIAVATVSLMQFDKKAGQKDTTAATAATEPAKTAVTADKSPTSPNGEVAAKKDESPWISAEALAKLATATLAVIGGVSFYFVYRLMRTIQRDIAAIMTAIDPERAAAQVGGDSMDSSFWTSSR